MQSYESALLVWTAAAAGGPIKIARLLLSGGQLHWNLAEVKAAAVRPGAGTQSWKMEAILS